MKKIQLSIIVMLSVAGAALSAFTTNKTTPPAGWYGQRDDNTPYETNLPVSLDDVNANCPTSTQHICAVELNMNGTVKTIRKSVNFYP